MKREECGSWLVSPVHGVTVQARRRCAALTLGFPWPDKWRARSSRASFAFCVAMRRSCSISWSFTASGTSAPSAEDRQKAALHHVERQLTEQGQEPLHSSARHRAPIAPAASGISFGSTTNRSDTASLAPSVPRPPAAVPRSAGSLPRSAVAQRLHGDLPLVRAKACAAARRTSAARCLTYGASAALDVLAEATATPIARSISCCSRRERAARPAAARASLRAQLDFVERGQRAGFVAALQGFLRAV